MDKDTIKLLLRKENIPTLVAFLTGLINHNKPRIYDNEFKTIVENAKVEGQVELINLVKNFNQY